MPPSLLHPPGQLSPADALHLSQRAPEVLRSSPSSFSPWSLASLWASSESPELWINYENLLLSCLRTGDEQAAHECLERLAKRFGDDNERIMAFKGLLQEADAENDAALERVLEGYNQLLSDKNTNIPITKRKIGLLRSLGRLSEAVSALLALLDFSPTDAEAWAELADMYFSQGLYPQAIHALEEVVVLTPNAWNIHARLGEMLYLAAVSSTGGEASTQRYLVEALKRYSRSIELCDDYLRGYYGLKLVTYRLLEGLGKSAKQQADAEDLAIPDTATVQRLGELATEKLSEIVRRSTARESGWRGYEEAEVAATRDLLAKHEAAVVR